jgi:hypothetical protein
MNACEVVMRLGMAAGMMLADVDGGVAGQQEATTAPALKPISEPERLPAVGVEPAPPAAVAQPMASTPWSGRQPDAENAFPSDDTGKLWLLLAALASSGLAARVFQQRTRAVNQRPRTMTWEPTMSDLEPEQIARRPPAPLVPAGEPTPDPLPADEPPLPQPEPLEAATQPSASLAPVADTVPPTNQTIETVSSSQPEESTGPEIPAPPAAHAPGAVEAIRETRALHSHQSWSSFNRKALPRLLFYGGNKFCQFSADRLEAADEWFVIGDIHGDFFALHTLVSFIRQACPGFGIIFLGDLIDRGPHPIECLWYLLKVADDHPDRVLWLAGNHDVGVRYDEAAGEFRSSVQPAEFVTDLNVVDSFAPLRRAFGREYIELSEGLPRAAVMPDGLFLTHGGFPHTDLQDELTRIPLGSDRRKWLESDPVVRDFTHLRISKYPMRRPNRLSISCSYGYKDFEAFRRAMAGYNVRRLVTGHQHAADGYDAHPDWLKNGQEALTLTGFGFADAYDRPEAYSVHYRRSLVVGRCRPDQLPEVVSIPVNEQDLSRFYAAEIATMPRFAAT